MKKKSKLLINKVEVEHNEIDSEKCAISFFQNMLVNNEEPDLDVEVLLCKVIHGDPRTIKDILLEEKVRINIDDVDCYTKTLTVGIVVNDKITGVFNSVKVMFGMVQGLTHNQYYDGRSLDINDGVYEKNLRRTLTLSTEAIKKIYNTKAFEGNMKNIGFYIDGLMSLGILQEDIFDPVPPVYFVNMMEEKGTLQ